jgi:sigma-B regulation protein RsbU (phosphoserine phosphatase)
VVFRPGGGRAFLERGGTVLGILEAGSFEEDRMTLVPGDRLVLYTDGVTEASRPNGDQFGEQRVCECIESLPQELSAREVAERLLAKVREYLEDAEPQDDVTLLVLRVLEPARVDAAVVAPPEAVAAS